MSFSANLLLDFNVILRRQKKSVTQTLSSGAERD